MRYGLPYKGSKNAIADWIVSELPSAETFVVYDIDYLLENLAREISMLYQAKRNFDKLIQKTIDKNE